MLTLEKPPVRNHKKYVTLPTNPISMTLKWFFFLFAALVLFSCQDDEKRLAEQHKDAQAKEVIFKNIEKGWNFTTPSLDPATQDLISNWAELRQFLSELNEKPKSTIGAFQKKAKTLSKKAADLNNNIPAKFDKPQIKARIAVLTTKINSINLFVNLDAIPDQKVIANVVDANIELQALYRQMEEIVRKSYIPKEQGESDMIKMLDTTRAIHAPTPPSPQPIRKKKFQ